MERSVRFHPMPGSPADAPAPLGLRARGSGSSGKWQLGMGGWQELGESPRPRAVRALPSQPPPGYTAQAAPLSAAHTAAPVAAPASRRKAAQPGSAPGAQRQRGGIAAAKATTGAPAKRSSAAAPAAAAGPLVQPPASAPNVFAFAGGRTAAVANATWSRAPSGAGCNCKQSRCLKLYCVCFAKGGVCGPECQCVSCHNKDANSEEVLAARAHSKKRAGVGGAGGDLPGCNCKQSRCQKKYCECYAAGRQCSPSCKCLNCENCAATRAGRGGGDGAQGPFVLPSMPAKKGGAGKAAHAGGNAAATLVKAAHGKASAKAAAAAMQDDAGGRARSRSSGGGAPKRPRLSGGASRGRSTAGAAAMPQVMDHGVARGGYAHQLGHRNPAVAAAKDLLVLSTPPGNRFRTGAAAAPGGGYIDPGLFGSSPLHAGHGGHVIVPTGFTPLVRGAGASAAHVALSPGQHPFGMHLEEMLAHTDHRSALEIPTWPGTITPLTCLGMPLNLDDGGRPPRSESAARLEFGVPGSALRDPLLSPSTCALLMATPQEQRTAAASGAGAAHDALPTTKASLHVAFANAAATPVRAGAPAAHEDGAPRSVGRAKRGRDSDVAEEQKAVQSTPTEPQWSLLRGGGRAVKVQHFQCAGVSPSTGAPCGARKSTDHAGVSTFTGAHTCGLQWPVTPASQTTLISGKVGAGGRPLPTTPPTQ